MKRSLIVAALAALLASCGPATNTPDAGPEVDVTCETGTATVTLTQVQTLITAKCFTACHSPAAGGMPAGTGLAYGDYSSVAKTFEQVGKLSLYKGTGGTLKVVEPNNLANSSLWLKVATKKALGAKGPKGEATGAKMPNDPAITLTDAEIKQFKDWICTGATM